jgi:hypothetical protein
MSSLKRKKNSRTFIEKEDTVIELTYNHDKFDKIDKKIIDLVEKTPSLIVNPKSKDAYEGLLIFLQTVSKDGYCSSFYEQYIDYYYISSDAIITLQTLDNDLIGYCMFSFDKDDINAHMICGNKNYKNIGTIILEMLKDIVKTLDFRRVILTSTTEALPFYLKRGFECINEQCPMEFILKKKKKNSKNKKNSTNKKNKKNNTDN